MNKLYSLLCFTICLLSFSPVQSQCSNGRYYDKIFSPSVSTVTYGNAMKFDSTYVDLKMDIYQPSGDQFAYRPLIVLAFPGSFTAGSRLSPDITQLCDNFVRRGYVCASIDYRLGFENGNDSDTNQFKAFMRGVQDMKAAVRYFYKDALTTNNYRIDTNQIFIGGTSAGAFIALNYAYLKLDTLSRTGDDWAPAVFLALGGAEGASGNPGYSTKVKGVIDLCGAIADTVWMMPGDPILVGVHGTDDATVSCYYDSVYASTHPESLLFGGGDIKNRLSHIPFNHMIYLFQGADHVPFILPIPYLPPASTYMDSTVWIVRDFLYQNVICDSALVSAVDDIRPEAAVAIFPNPSEDFIQIVSSERDELQAEVFSIGGRLIARKTLASYSTLKFAKQDFSPGTYLLQISDVAKTKLKVERIVFY
jgi:para-nitrobenzyl esterase